MSRPAGDHRTLFEALTRLAVTVDAWPEVTGVSVAYDEGPPDTGPVVMIPDPKPAGVTMTIHATDHAALHRAWNRAAGAINGGGIGLAGRGQRAGADGDPPVRRPAARADAVTRAAARHPLRLPRSGHNNRVTLLEHSKMIYSYLLTL